MEFRNSEEFKEMMERYAGSLYAESVKNDDTFILKFLRDRSGNVKKALQLFATMMEWRHTENVDDALSWRFDNISQVKEFYPHRFHSFDKEGRPIYIERVGQLDIDKTLKHMSLYDFTRYHILHWEFVQRVLFERGAQRVGHKVDQLVTIVDLSGLSLSLLNSTTIEFLQRIAKIDQEYYPDSAHKLYIVNVPWLFKAVWKILRPLLGARGRAKIEILRGNFGPILMDEIGVDALPDFLGGNRDWTLSEEDGIWCDLVSGKFDIDHDVVNKDSFPKELIALHQSVKLQE